MTKVLIVGSDESLNDGLEAFFDYEGYTVELVDRNRPQQVNSSCRSCDLVFVDGDVPGVDATATCRQLNSTNERIPIIVLSVKEREIDKASALMAGADDYIVRPFGYLELSARVKAVLRRASASAAARLYRFGSVTVDLERQVVTKSGKVLELSPRELDILLHFIQHEGEIVTRQQLLEAIWGESGHEMTRPIDMHIVKLRRKVEDRGKPQHIQTVRNVGYRFVGGPRHGR